MAGYLTSGSRAVTEIQNFRSQDVDEERITATVVGTPKDDNVAPTYRGGAGIGSGSLHPKLRDIAIELQHPEAWIADGHKPGKIVFAHRPSPNAHPKARIDALRRGCPIGFALRDRDGDFNPDGWQ